MYIRIVMAFQFRNTCIRMLYFMIYHSYSYLFPLRHGTVYICKYIYIYIDSLFLLCLNIYISILTSPYFVWKSPNATCPTHMSSASFLATSHVYIFMCVYIYVYILVCSCAYTCTDQKSFWYWSGSYRKADLIQSLNQNSYHNCDHNYDHKCYHKCYRKVDLGENSGTSWSRQNTYRNIYIYI